MSISSVDSGPLHVKSPTDLNLATEAKRILFVLNKIISRSKLVGLLDNFLKDEAFLLKNILDSNSQLYVLSTCDKYHFSILNRIPSIMRSLEISQSVSSKDSSKKTMRLDGQIVDDDSESVYSGSTVARSDSRSSKFKDRNDIALSKVIYMLEENKEIQKLVNYMESEISPPMKIFIKTMTEFKDRMVTALHENATQYKTRENYFRETYEKNERAIEEIGKLEEALVVTKTDANVCLIGRNILIKRHQNKIEKIQQNSQEAIERRVNESEKAMVNDWKNSMIEQERLKNDLEQASEKYYNSLKDHLALEKVLRAKRTKVENQVLGWIQKFDQDIGEKQAEEEEIQALLDEETKLVDEIQRKLDEQEEEYDELMQEKAEYEEEMLDRRLYQFIMNRSARRIQRTFRLYKARKLAKKLAKKGKKGKGKKKK